MQDPHYPANNSNSETHERLPSTFSDPLRSNADQNRHGYRAVTFSTLPLSPSRLHRKRAAKDAPPNRRAGIRLAEKERRFSSNLLANCEFAGPPYRNGTRSNIQARLG